MLSDLSISFVSYYELIPCLKNPTKLEHSCGIRPLDSAFRDVIEIPFLWDDFPREKDLPSLRSLQCLLHTV